MICVSIACGSHKRVLAEHQRLAEDKVELAELRIDFINKEPDLMRLVKDRPTPVIVTARRKQDGGLWRDSETKRFRVLREAILLGVEYVDLEEDIAKSIPRHGSTKRIISYHNLDETPEDLVNLWKRMAACDPDIIKIATMPKNITDVFRMMEFVRKANTSAKIPTIGICMGEMGFVTRVLAPKFGSPFTYATFSESRTIAPGLPLYKTLRDMYRFDQINEDTNVLGVVGDPIGHSLSPLIHNYSCAAQQLNTVYLPFRVLPEDIDTFLDRAPEIGVRGLSVTIPHKVAVLKKLTRCDPAVEEIGACNTVILDNFDRFGYNTDYKAAVFSIETAMGGKVNDVSPIQGKTALVLGAGGAGKALAYGLRMWGAKIAVTDVDHARAKIFGEQLQCDVVEWNLRHGFKCQILVNCTPVGMHPKVDETPFDRNGLHEGMVVFDAIYNPENTLLIKNAKFKGCIPVTGIEMFVGQACLQFRHFTGKPASASLMRKLLRNAISAVHTETE
ncbi:MAG: type I 3-dehydroquinate dehydratase [Planctomycetaceae bacterium]|jgi:3-dehydroquinate dehydratase/shikimate dehydrogenase|nr:type I 3-dehydroquinate dehydratase [Planctomycetaceae bacterium]